MGWRIDQFDHDGSLCPSADPFGSSCAAKTMGAEAGGSVDSYGMFWLIVKITLVDHLVTRGEKRSVPFRLIYDMTNDVRKRRMLLVISLFKYSYSIAS